MINSYNTKIDKRKRYLIGLDTETGNAQMKNGKMDLSESLVYDIGWAVTDYKGNIMETYSYIVKEIWEMDELMNSAYYANKIPRYEKDILEGKRSVRAWSTICQIFRSCMEYWGCNTVFAHNTRFDLNALNNTQRYLTQSRYRYFFPYGTILWDTNLMVNNTIAKQKTYKRFCERNGYMTNHKTPRVQTKAEVLYKYIIGDVDFIEEHTGLEDVLIETQIMSKCVRQHKKMRKELFIKKDFAIEYEVSDYEGGTIVIAAKDKNNAKKILAEMSYSTIIENSIEYHNDESEKKPKIRQVYEV